MRTLCYSVRLASMVKISAKAYKAQAFDGSCAVLPASQVYGEDCEVSRSGAWWVSAWILERKGLQYSTRKQAYFDSETRRMLPSVTYHKAGRHEAVDDNIIHELKR